MIIVNLKKQSFQYQNRTLIEKVLVSPPYKHERVFQNEGCFLYLKGAEGTLMSTHDKFKFDNGSKEAVLLKCDTYYLDFIKSSRDNQVELIAIHLYPDILKKLYLNELPRLIKNKSDTSQTKKWLMKSSLLNLLSL